MKFPKEDFPLIRAAVILFTMAVILTSGAIYGTSRLREISDLDKINAQKQQSDNRRQLDQINDEEQKIRQYLAKYRKIIGQGLIGEGNRLDWLEHIAKVKESSRLYSLDYKLSAQQPVTVDPSLPAGDIKIFASNLNLEISMLHEGQLLGVLNDLRGNNKGILLPRKCSLGRVEKDAKASSANIKAECTLAWVTMHSDAAEAAAH